MTLIRVNKYAFYLNSNAVSCQNILDFSAVYWTVKENLIYYNYFFK